MLTELDKQYMYILNLKGVLLNLSLSNTSDMMFVCKLCKLYESLHSIVVSEHRGMLLLVYFHYI